IALENGVADILIAIPSVPRTTLLKLIRSCEDARLRVMVVPSLADLATAAGPVAHLGGIPLIQACGDPIQSWGEVLKRAFDVVVSAGILLLTAPLIALIALAIRLDSPGPAFFFQRRVGRSGKHFLMFKFRSMYTGAEQQRRELEHLNESQGGV